MPKLTCIVKAERLAHEDLLDVVRSVLFINPVQMQKYGEQMLLPQAYHYEAEKSGVPYFDLHDGDVVTMELDDAAKSGNRLVEDIVIHGNLKAGVFMEIRTSKVEGELDG